MNRFFDKGYRDGYNTGRSNCPYYFTESQTKDYNSGFELGESDSVDDEIEIDEELDDDHHNEYLNDNSYEDDLSEFVDSSLYIDDY